MRKPYARLALLLFSSLATALHGCGTEKPHLQPLRTTVPEEGVELKAQNISNLLLVPLLVNGQGPFLFLVDTGSGSTIVSFGLADKLSRYVEFTAQTVTGAAGKPVSVRRIFHIERLRAGEALFEYLDALVVDLEGLSRALGVTVDGIAGFPLFVDCLLTLDHEAGTIRLTNGHLDETDGAETLPFRLSAARPALSIRIGDQDLPVVLDSGSSSLLVLPPDAMEFRFNHGPVPGSLGTTITGAHRSAIGKLSDALQIGQFVIHEPVVVLLGSEPLIGGAALHYFEATFDSRNRRVRFRRHSDEPIAGDPVRTTGLAFEKREFGWQVADIIPDTPAAEADVQPGDRLVTFEGRPANEFSRNAWAELESQQDELRVEMRRGDLVIETTLSVMVLVP